MDYHIVFLPEVVDDLSQAINWYNNQRKGLGKNFVSSVKRCYSLLKRDPFCIAVKYDDIRCLPVSGFPYIMHYRVEKDSRTVVIFAVYHTSRNPEIWKLRM
jgi:hypothetical protein